MMQGYNDIMTLFSGAVVVCEGGQTSITCASGKLIQVDYANYGRTDKVTCTHKAMSNTACFATTYVQN